MAPASRTLLKDPKFKETVELFGKMRGLVDPGSPGRNWNDATALVITNKAAMHFNGDWAKGEFTAAGQTRRQGIRLHPRGRGARSK